MIRKTSVSSGAIVQNTNSDFKKPPSCNDKLQRRRVTLHRQRRHNCQGHRGRINTAARRPSVWLWSWARRPAKHLLRPYRLLRQHHHRRRRPLHPRRWATFWEIRSQRSTRCHRRRCHPQPSAPQPRPRQRPSTRCRISLCCGCGSNTDLGTAESTATACAVAGAARSGTG